MVRIIESNEPGFNELCGGQETPVTGSKRWTPVPAMTAPGCYSPALMLKFILVRRAIPFYAISSSLFRYSIIQAMSSGMSRKFHIAPVDG
jgi:hypothetical protein